jgi:putative ABC transport system ATP-binding protein
MIPDEGSYQFNGIEVAKFNERKRADLRKRNIGFVFQSFNLIDELTVFENVELPLIYTGVKGAERKKRVEAVWIKCRSCIAAITTPSNYPVVSSNVWLLQEQ